MTTDTAVAVQTDTDIAFGACEDTDLTDDPASVERLSSATRIFATLSTAPGSCRTEQ